MRVTGGSRAGLQRTSLDLLFRALDSAPVGLAISSWKDGRFVQVNTRFCTLTGYTRQQIIGMSGRMLDMWVNPAERRTFAHELIRHGRVTSSRHEYRPRHGGIRVGQISSEIVNIDGAKYIVTSFVDITEQTKAEGALRDSEARLRAITNAIPDITMIVDMNGRLIEIVASPGDADPHSAESADIQGRLLHDVFPTETADAFLASIKRTISSGAAQVLEYSLELQSGTRWYEARSAPLRDSAGEVWAAVWVARDISARKWAEEQLKKESQERRFFARQLIDVQEREREHISRELHDDLGQILTALKLDVRRLMQNADDAAMVRASGEEVVEHLNVAMDSVRTMSFGLRPGILDDLGLGPALESLANRISDAPDLVITVLIDPLAEGIATEAKTALYRITQEALTNILRHSGATHASITLTTHASVTTVQIADNGCGIPVSELEKPSGLGISGMRERAALIDGEMRVTRRLDGGTEVTVVVPGASA